TVRDIKITGLYLINEAEVGAVLGVIPGETFDQPRLRKGFDNLKSLYASRGYINFTAIPFLDIDEPQKIVNVAVNIIEDRPFTVNRINFTGNTRQPDEIIRREIMVKEGEVFNSVLWNLSLSRLNQLGYFDNIRSEDAEIKPSSTEPKLDITLNLREKR